MKSKSILYLIFFSFLFLMIILENYFSHELTFIIKTFYLLSFLTYEIISYKRLDPTDWLINPFVLASIFTFILGFGITNIIFFLPPEITSNYLYNKLGPEPFGIMSKAMNSVIFGAIAMWFGYKSRWGLKLYKFLLNNIFDVRKFLRRSFELNYLFIYLILILSIIFRIVAINLGVYGYSQTQEANVAAAGIIQILYYFGIFSNLALLAVSLSYYVRKESKIKYLMVLIIIVELFFGLLSGMKSAVVVPVLIPLLSYLIINKKIKKSLIMVSIVLVIIAYIIIEPFRILRNMDLAFKSEPVYILSTMVDSYQLNKSRALTEKWSTDPIYIQLLKRNNYVMDASKAIEFKDERGLTQKDPDFINRLLTIPAQAFIPRAFWSSKPLENIGAWFTVTVWNFDLLSSTAMSPFGFLYFAGGNLLVIIFFFIFGIMQKALFQFTRHGSGGILLFVGLLASVVMIDSAVNTIFVSWLRNYPIIIFLQYFAFKR